MTEALKRLTLLKLSIQQSYVDGAKMSEPALEAISKLRQLRKLWLRECNLGDR